MAAPLLRLRSDDQLVALFRAGHDEAFRVIHDRYRQRLFAYTRQMLPGSSQDAEDVLQDVFVRAYSGLRANRRELALRPWLYRVAHNRCIDELRRPFPAPSPLMAEATVTFQDPIAQAEQRESLRRLIADLLRLPTQQRSALLMRELGGMSYAEVADAMDVTVSAVKSLLVRARIGLTLAAEARDTACVEIRDELTLAHDRGVRCSGTVRRHVTDCGGCREFQTELRRSRHQFAALSPGLGPIGVLANVLGIGGAGGGAGMAAASGATATTGAVVGGSAVGAVGTLGAGASHVVALIAAAVVTAGGAVAIQHSIVPPAPHHATPAPATNATSSTAAAAVTPAVVGESYRAPVGSSQAAPAGQAKPTAPATTSQAGRAKASSPSISGGDNIVPTATPPGGASSADGTGAASTATGTTGTTSTTGTTGTAGTTGATASTGTTGTTGATTSGAAGTPGTTGSAGATGTGTTGTAGSTTGTSSTTGTGSTTGSGTGSTTGSGSAAGTSSGTTTAPTAP